MVIMKFLLEGDTEEEAITEALKILGWGLVAYKDEVR